MKLSPCWRCSSPAEGICSYGTIFVRCSQRGCINNRKRLPPSYWNQSAKTQATLQAKKRKKMPTL